MRATLLRLGAILLSILATSAGSARELPSFDDGLAELRGGNPERARTIFVELLDVLATGGGEPEESRADFGSLLLHRGVAEFQLGHERDARWSWHMALAMSPDLAGEKLSSLTLAEEFLDTNRPRDLEPDVTFSGLRKAQKATASPDCFSREHWPIPHYPEKLRRKATQANVKVIFFVLEDGTLDSPRLATRGNHPAFEYASLEILRVARCAAPSRQAGPIGGWRAFELHFRLR